MVLRKQILENTQVVSLPNQNDFVYNCKIDGYRLSARKGFELVWETQNKTGEICNTVKNKKNFVDWIYYWLNYA